MTEISVCILNWQQYDVLTKSLNQIRQELSSISHEVIVYDQESNNDKNSFLRDPNLVDVPILSAINTGNSISRNKMINQASGRYIFLIDSDIIPIPKSLASLYHFLEQHKDYVGVGYDPYCLSTTNFSKCTPEECTIKIEDTILENEFVLSQYGLFKREALLDFPFPEFGPFSSPGWGAEDSISGLALFANGHKVARILGRTYWHKTHSSTHILAEDYLPSRARRRAYWHYFSKLNPADMKASLQNQSIKVTNLDLNLYSIFSSANDQFRLSENLGDKLFPWLLSRFFPFFQFSLNSHNTLFFGGSVFHHLQNISKKQNCVVYFGCGVSNETELEHFKQCSDIIVYPRGFNTYDILKSKKILTKPPIGDPALCLTMLPRVPFNNTGKEIFVIDAFKKEYNFEDEQNRIAVAKTELTKHKKIISDIDKFFCLLKTTKHLSSSQIHPFLISTFRGIPARIFKKDLRADDILNFFDMPESVRYQDIMAIRQDTQTKHLENFIFSLIDTLINFR